MIAAAQQNAGLYVSKMAMRSTVPAGMRTFFNTPGRGEAELLLEKFLARYGTSAPKLVQWAEKAIPEGFTVFA